MSNFSLIIRPIEKDDAREINIIRRMPKVLENIMSVPSETIMKNEEFISKLTKDDHVFCAQLDGTKNSQLVGVAGLHVKALARSCHSAVLGIMVHQDFHGQGVGSMLMAALIDVADNWLMLKRIELTVFPSNKQAIKLYEKFGFVHEGTMKYAAIYHGVLSDILMMARYRV